MRRTAPSGFTLPEVLLAVLLLAVGITALASTAFSLSRASGEAREMSAAALLAGAVFDSLRAAPCRSLGGGTAMAGPNTVRWVAQPDTHSVLIAVTVELRRGGAVRRWPIETLLPCDR